MIRSNFITLRLVGLLSVWLVGKFAGHLSASESPAFCLLTNAEVTSDGIFLEQVASCQETLPHLRLGDAPAFGRTLTLTRKQIEEALLKNAPELAVTNWEGAAHVRVARRKRPVAETEIKEMLTRQLQQDHVRDRGELELRLMRPWTGVQLPDEALTLKISDLPAHGVSGNFIVRFEVSTAREPVGAWQMPVQAKIWREVWVARSPLARGQLLVEADLARERRDVLALRDLWTGPAGDLTYEAAENLPVGAPFSTRSVALRPLVKRGQIADAVLRDKGLTISLKVEVLESGASGQTVRVRNLQSRREFRGKVENEQTILVSL